MFKKSGYNPDNAEVANIPSTSINLDASQFSQITKLAKEAVSLGN